MSALQDRIATVELDGSRVVRVAAAVQVKGQLAGVLEGRGNGRRCLRSSVVETVVPDQLIAPPARKKKFGNLPLGIVNGGRKTLRSVFARPSSRWWRLTASYSCPCCVRRLASAPMIVRLVVAVLLGLLAAAYEIGTVPFLPTWAGFARFFH